MKNAEFPSTGIFVIMIAETGSIAPTASSLVKHHERSFEEFQKLFEKNFKEFFVEFLELFLGQVWSQGGVENGGADLFCRSGANLSLISGVNFRHKNAKIFQGGHPT